MSVELSLLPSPSMRALKGESALLITINPHTFFDFSFATSSVNLGWPIVAWSQVVIELARAGAVIKSNTILRNSVIVSGEAFEEWKDDLEELERLGLLSTTRFDPLTLPAKRKSPTKSVSRRLAAQKAPSEITSAHFDRFWHLYPERDGKKARRSETQTLFTALIRDLRTYTELMTCLENYTKSSAVVGGFAKDAPNWLRDYQDWLTPEDLSNRRRDSGRRLTQAEINRGGTGKVIT